MQIIRVLKNRDVALLCSGQALSAVGDEIYRVVVVWVAVQKMGAVSGYLVASQVGAIFLLSLCGGGLLNHWSFRSTLIWIDLLRFFVLVLLVLVASGEALSLWLFVPAIVLVSSLTALFEPAMQGMVPQVADGVVGRHAVNGLLLTTRLMARILGPVFISGFAMLLPMIHFFTIDALTFAVSALTIALLSGKNTPVTAREIRRSSAFLALKLLEGQGTVRKLILAKFLVSGAWYASFSVGLALFVNQRLPGDFEAYGRVVTAYGIGSVLGVIWVGQMKIRRPALLATVGIMATGLGFMGIAFSRVEWQIGLFAAVSALGGPMFDLAFLKLIQERFHATDLSHVYRMRVTVDNGSMLIFLLIAPWILTIAPAATVMACFGGMILVVGGAGALHFLRERPSS